MSGIIATSTTESLEQMQSDLGLTVPAAAGSSPAGAVTLELTDETSPVTPPAAPSVDLETPTSERAADEDTDHEPPAGDTPPAPKDKAERARSANARISEINQKWRDEQLKVAAEKARADALEAVVLKLGGKPTGDATPTPVVPAAADAEPQEDQFGSWGEYHKALVAYNVQTTLKAETEKREREAHQRDAATALTAAETEFTAAEALEKADHPDYEEVVPHAEVPFDPHSPAARDLHTLILKSVDAAGKPMGPAVLYHLATHPEDAQAFTVVTSQAELFRAFGRIEARVEASRATGIPVPVTPPKPVPVSTRAVAPVRPVTGARAVVAVTSDDDSLPYKEWEAAREAELRRKMGSNRR